MIRIEVEDFTVDVPIEKQMTVPGFLKVADRLERLFGNRSEPAPRIQEETHHPAPHEPEPDGFGPAVPSDIVAEEPHHEQPYPEQPSFPPHHHHEHHEVEAFKFEHEEEARMEYLLSRLLHKLDSVEDIQDRLEALENRMLDRTQR